MVGPNRRCPDAPDPETLEEFHAPFRQGERTLIRPVAGHPTFDRLDTYSSPGFASCRVAAVDHHQLAYLADQFAPRRSSGVTTHGPRRPSRCRSTSTARPRRSRRVGDDYMFNEAIGTRGERSTSGQHARLWSRSGALLVDHRSTELVPLSGRPRRTMPQGPFDPVLRSGDAASLRGWTPRVDTVTASLARRRCRRSSRSIRWSPWSWRWPLPPRSSSRRRSGSRSSSRSAVADHRSGGWLLSVVVVTTPGRRRAIHRPVGRSGDGSDGGVRAAHLRPHPARPLRPGPFEPAGDGRTPVGRTPGPES